MVPVGGARLPHRSLRRDGLDDPVPTQHVIHGHLARHRGEAGLVRQHPPERYLAFALGGELGPVAGHGSLEIEHAPLDEEVHTGGRDPLGGGEHELQGVCIPWSAAVSVCQPSPQVHDRATPVVDAHGRADVAVLSEVRGERISDRLERWIAPPVHLDRRTHRAEPTRPTSGRWSGSIR